MQDYRLKKDEKIVGMSRVVPPRNSTTTTTTTTTNVSSSLSSPPRSSSTVTSAAAATSTTTTTTTTGTIGGGPTSTGTNNDKKKKPPMVVDDDGSTTTLLNNNTIEQDEAYARDMEQTNPFLLFVEGTLAAFKVFAIYLITLDTIMACSACIGLTIYWYNISWTNENWFGGGMDWIILGFAVVTPMTSSLAMAFRRRERALIEIGRVRSFSFQIYLAHALWDWPVDAVTTTNTGPTSGSGRQRASTINNHWVDHCDKVMAQLIGVGDELCRFLSLPTSSRSRHRMLKSGRREAARTVKAAYRLFDSLYTQRMVRITTYDERLKAAGLPATEVSRLRQYERFMGEAMENLRMLKMYRTPQALRSFARIFTLILPAFYAPTFAQLARDVNSLGMGIAFGLLIAVGLSGLFNAIQVLEDPFVGYLTLDGINVTEEFEVLQWQQLVNARTMLFPDASPFPCGTRTALPSGEAIPELARARTEGHHKKVVSWDQQNMAEIDFGGYVGDIRKEEDDPMMHKRLRSVSDDVSPDIRVSQFAPFLPEEELDQDVASSSAPLVECEDGTQRPLSLVRNRSTRAFSSHHTTHRRTKSTSRGSNHSFVSTFRRGSDHS